MIKISTRFLWLTDEIRDDTRARGIVGGRSIEMQRKYEDLQ